MITCFIIALTVSCSNLPSRPSPSEALKVLAHAVPAFVALAPHVRLSYVSPVAHNPSWPFLTPATPIAPLSTPWRVTTVTTRNGVITYFNGRPIR